MNDANRQHSDDDALLSALIDGELPPERVAGLRARLESEPALAQRYESLRRADRKVRDAFASFEPGPMPESVLRLLRDENASDSAASSNGGKVVSLRSSRRFYRPPLALAAGVALFFLGFALAQVLLPRAAGPELSLADAAGAVDEGSPLHQALQTARSGESVRLENELVATPRMTFKRTGDGYCRLVDVTGNRGVTSTVACRANGNWKLQVVSFQEKAPASPGNGYRLASGGQSPAIERTIDNLIAGAPLGIEEESELLQHDWRKP